MREQFENMPEVHKKLKDLHPTIVWFSDQENEYASSFDGFQSMVIWLNGAWYAYQEQQKNIDVITKQRDSFIKAHHIAMDDACKNKAKIDELQARIDKVICRLDKGICHVGSEALFNILTGNKDESIREL